MRLRCAPGGHAFVARTGGYQKEILAMRRVALVVLVVVAALTAAVAPSGAITGGELDGNGHPNVAMIAFYQPDGRFRCSATLVSPTVLITAAHCTDGVRGKTIVTFNTVSAEL